MNGPDGKPIHAEHTLRGATLMLGAESPDMGKRTVKSIGASPAGLFIYVENVDQVVAKSTGLGAIGQGPVMDMFWGDRCGTIENPNGYTWTVGTHKAEPTAKGNAREDAGTDAPAGRRYGQRCLNNANVLLTFRTGKIAASGRVNFHALPGL